MNRNALLRGKCKGNPKIMSRHSPGNVSKSSWRPFEKYCTLKVIGDSFWEMPKEYWRPFQQPLPSTVADNLWEMPKKK